MWERSIWAMLLHRDDFFVQIFALKNRVFWTVWNIVANFYVCVSEFHVVFLICVIFKLEQLVTFTRHASQILHGHMSELLHRASNAHPCRLFYLFDSSYWFSGVDFTSFELMNFERVTAHFMVFMGSVFLKELTSW